MIRFERKPDPQPSLKEAETNRTKQISEAAKEENKKWGTTGTRSRAPQAADDDRLIREHIVGHHGLFLIWPARMAGSFVKFNVKRIASMAKGQVRGNREARKPKKEKAPVKVETSFTNQLKNAEKSSPQGGKHKG